MVREPAAGRPLKEVRYKGNNEEREGTSSQMNGAPDRMMREKGRDWYNLEKGKSSGLEKEGVLTNWDSHIPRDQAGREKGRGSGWGGNREKRRFWTGRHLKTRHGKSRRCHS